MTNHGADAIADYDKMLEEMSSLQSRLDAAEKLIEAAREVNRYCGGEISSKDIAAHIKLNDAFYVYDKAAEGKG